MVNFFLTTRIFLMSALTLVGATAAGQSIKIQINPGGGSTVTQGEVKIANAVLPRRIAVGEQGSFAITVENGRPTGLPTFLEVEGLVFRPYEINSIGFPVTTKYLFSYPFIAKQEGEFTIPSIKFEVNGKPYETDAVVVTAYIPKPDEVNLDPSKPYFAVMKIDAKEVYRNQIVPVSMTVFSRGRGTLQETGNFNLQHDEIAFRPSRGRVNGIREIDPYLFDTMKQLGAIFPLKAGEFTIGPTRVDARVILIQKEFGRENYMNTVVKMESNALALNVKPLPAGAPDTFTGGVGNFELKATADVSDLTLGDPISIDLEVSGIGNFEIMEAPHFQPNQPADWKVYESRKQLDPTENSDGVTAGRVVFSQIIIPKIDTTSIPPFQLSYFDPATATYETLTTEPIPITLKPDPRANFSAAPPAVSPIDAAAPDKEKPEPNFNDIVTAASSDSPTWRSLPVAVTAQPLFWIGQAVPSVGLFTLIGFGFARWLGNRKRKPSDDGNAVSFARAVAAIPESPSPRPEFYRAVKNALEAWERENSQSKRDALPDDILRAKRALDSRCEWLLYGADDARRDAQVSEREIAETHGILRRLGAKEKKANASNTEDLGF